MVAIAAIISSVFLTASGAVANVRVGSASPQTDGRTRAHVADSSARAPTDGGSAVTRTSIPFSPVRLLGQRIMVGFDGTTPTPSLLRLIRAGAVGSVILFAHNIASRAQLTALTRGLQRTASQGGNPPLLIALDQEGGQVKRLPSGPPDLSPPEIAANGSATVASREGRTTGRYLKALGVNMDLAPVLDVPTFPGAFIWQQGRAFSFSTSAVATYGTAFALGLQSAGIAAAGKHFPGLGSAAIDTDTRLQELHPTRTERASALVPYRALIPRGLDAVMLSTAGFPAYDSTGTPAALSQRITGGLLRAQLGFTGVAITDAISPPVPTGHDEATAGVLGARAGADILLYTDSAAPVLPALRNALRSGRISHPNAVAAYARIVALKRRVAGG